MRLRNTSNTTRAGTAGVTNNRTAFKLNFIRQLVITAKLDLSAVDSDMGGEISLTAVASRRETSP